MCRNIRPLFNFEPPASDAEIVNQVYNAATNTTTADFIVADVPVNQLFLSFRNTRRTASGRDRRCTACSAA